MLGQLLGFMRTQIINANFPVTGPNSTDAYFAAFKIPDLFFYTIAAGALGVAFMPFLADRLQKGDKKVVWEITSSLLNLLGIFMLAVGVVLFIFAEPLIRLIINHDLSPQQLHSAASIMRLIALNPLLFAISGILTSVQQTFGRFFFFAIGPLVYNVCIIASAYIFHDTSLGLTGLGIGAMVGAVLQLVVVCFGLIGLNFKYYFAIKWRLKDFRDILRQLPARSIDQGVDSINSIVETNRASHLGVGNITYYENAYILHAAPISLVGTAISTAAFPRLTERLSQGRNDLFRKEFLQVLRAMIWIIVPIVVISYFARGYFARMIFKRGSGEIAIIFGFLSVAILFRTVYTIVSRYFYAHKDTRTPLYVSLFTIALNVFLVFSLAKPKPGGFDIAGLALAQSIAAATEVFILMFIMSRKDRLLFTRNFWMGILNIVSVTGFTVLTAFIMVKLLPLSSTDVGFVTLGAKLFFIVAPTMLVHLAISSLFGLEEARPVVQKIHKIIFRPVKIQ